MIKSTTNTDIRIGDFIRRVRTARAMSQSELAGHLSLTFQQIQKYEKGTNRVSASRLQDIANIFGMKIQDFFPEQIDAADGHIPMGSKDARKVAMAFDKIADANVRKRVKAMIFELAKVDDEGLQAAA